jgi:Uma2 family endonuclease
MSTITAPPPVATTRLSFPKDQVVPGEQRIVIRDVNWHVYETLVDSIGEGQHVRLAYDGKDLEIMTTGYMHEDYKILFGRLMYAVTVELDISCIDAGQTTWKRPHMERGLEADHCYFFDPEKMAAVEASRALKSNNVDDYPDPDLAIEIDLSRAQIDRPGIYAALKVFEVWRFDGETLVIEQLQPDGSYVQTQTSRYVPIRPDEIVSWVNAEDAGKQTAWERRLRAWIRAELAPRQQGQP